MSKETSSTPISAVILASGAGTRLGEITSATPKPLLSFDGKPFLHYLINWTLDHNVDDIVLTTHYHADQIEDFVAANNHFDGRVRTVREPALINTIESTRAGLSEVKNDTSLILIADTIWDLDLHDVIREHQDHGSDLTVVASALPDVPNFGMMKVKAGEGNYRRISEMWPAEGQPRPAKPDEQAVSTMGMYIVNAAKLLTAIQEGDTSIDREPMDRLRSNGYGYVNSVSYYNFDTPEQFQFLQENSHLIAEYMR